MAATLHSLGEFGLIHRLQNILKTPRRPGVVGIGDDASVFPWGKNSYLLLSQDLLLEGVHFLPAKGKAWRQLGWKALAVNLSDIAAMGGKPLQAVVGLGLPKKFPVSAIEELYRGLNSCAKHFH